MAGLLLKHQNEFPEQEVLDEIRRVGGDENSNMEIGDALQRLRMARAIDPETWSGIDKMSAIGRDAPYLRRRAQGSLAAVDRLLALAKE